MKKTYFRFFIGITTCLCIWGCYDITMNHRLSITNDSNRELSILYLNDMDMHIENHIDYYLSDYILAKPDSSIDIVKVGNANAWHEFIQEGKSKKLYLCIFDTDTLKHYNNGYSMDDLVRMRKYLKLFTYSEQQLNEIDWKVTFSQN